MPGPRKQCEAPDCSQWFDDNPQGGKTAKKYCSHKCRGRHFAWKKYNEGKERGTCQGCGKPLPTRRTVWCSDLCAHPPAEPREEFELTMAHVVYLEAFDEWMQKRDQPSLKRKNVMLKAMMRQARTRREARDAPGGRENAPLTSAEANLGNLQ